MGGTKRRKKCDRQEEGWTLMGVGRGGEGEGSDGLKSSQISEVPTRRKFGPRALPVEAEALGEGRGERVVSSGSGAIAVLWP